MKRRSAFRTISMKWRFDEPMQVHVLEGENGTIIFGGGDESTQEAYRDVVETHHPDVIIVEHGDPDHFGSLPAIDDLLAEITIAIPEGDARYLAAAGIELDVLLQPSGTYWGIETVPVPGHTPDNMAYLFEDVLIAGDTVVGSDSIFASDEHWSGPLALISPEYHYDHEMARESVGILREYDFDSVLVSHGSNVETDGMAAVETLLRDAN